jgi:hypothetical protein
MARTTLASLAAVALFLAACQGIGQLGAPADHAADPATDDSPPDGTRPDGGRPDDSRPVDPQPDDSQPDDSQPDDSQPDVDPCGGVDERGECDGDVARYCAGDRLVEEDCAAVGEVCVADAAGAGCLAPDDEPDPVEPDPSGEGCGHPVVVEELALTNDARQRAGLGALACDEALTRAATLHSEDMCDRDYFSHTSRDGRSHDERMRDAGATFSTSGENIAWGQGSASEVHRTWMNSWGHRANILGRQYGRIGIGYAPCGGSPYWTQNFAD